MEIKSDDICRICLKESLFYFNIGTYEVVNGKQLLEVINDLLHLDAECDDGFPQFVCPDCYKNISEFELFKRTAHEGKHALYTLRSSYGDARMKSECSKVASLRYGGCSKVIQSCEESISDPDDVQEEDDNHLGYHAHVKSDRSNIASQHYGGSSKMVQSCEKTVADPNNEEEDDEDLSYPDVEVKKEIEELTFSSSEDQQDNVNSVDLTDDDQDLDFDVNWQVNVKIEEGTEPIKFQEEDYEEEQTGHGSLYGDSQVPGRHVAPRNASHMSQMVAEQDVTSNKMVAGPDPLKPSSVRKDGLRRRNNTAQRRSVGKRSTEQQGPSYDSCPSNRDPYNRDRTASIIPETGAEDGSRLRENFAGDGVGDGYQNDSYVRPKEVARNNPDEPVAWAGSPGKLKHAKESESVGGKELKKPAPAKAKYICDTCGKVYTKKSSLGEHVMYHTGEMDYECPKCGKRFTCKRYAERHVAVHEKPMNVCTVCGKEFQQKGFLNKHMKIHTGERNHACEVCGKRFLQNAALVVHLRVHTGETPYMCSVCGKKFKQSGDLKHHMVSHSGEKPFECQECGARFGSKMVYKNHLVRHGDARPFSCRLCDKSFKLRHHLMVHQKLHEDYKPHKCPVCEKHFHRADNLKVHMRCHTGERPYSCSECGKCFTQSSSLRLHLRSSCKGRNEGN